MAAGPVLITLVLGDSRRKVWYWSDDGTLAGNLTPIVQASTTGPAANVTTQLARASGVTPVTGAFTATGYSGWFTPQTGRDINVFLGGSAYVGVSIQLERSWDGANSYPLTVGGANWAIYAAPCNEAPWNEPESNVQFRLNCTTFTSAVALNYRISH